MARDKVLELTLKKACVELPSRGAGKVVPRLVIVTSVWPRPLVEGRTVGRAVEFTDGEADLRKAAWGDRVMMKELVSGPFSLRVSVTERAAEPLTSDFLRFLGQGLMKAAGAEADRAAATALGGDLARLPFLYLADAVGRKTAKAPGTVASGAVDLHAERTWKSKKTVTVKVPLTAVKNIYELPSGKGRARAKKRRLVHRKGDTCGYVTLVGVRA
jgi:hypothetical protein